MPNNFGEVGRSGLQTSSGVVFEEFLGQLRGAAGRRALREMADNDPIIGGILLAFEKTLSRLDWHIDVQEDATPKDREASEFVQECLDDMSDSWPSTLSTILSCMTYGWSYHEIVYKKREGANTDASRNSLYSDGRIGWRKWPIRSQETLMKWEFDDNGGIQAMVQQILDGGEFTIPIEKALLFRTSTARNNPEGRSLLRNAYRPWYFKKRIEEIEAVGIERDLAGLPVAYLAPEYFASDATDDEKALLGHLEDLVRSVKRNEMEGVVFPLAYDENGNPRMKLELLSTGGSRQFDTDKIVGRYNQQIAMSVLADFLLLGHEGVGSYSLGASKVELWMMACDAVAKSIAEVINQHAIPRLLKLNGITVDSMPEIVYGDVANVDLSALSEFVKAMSDAGVITPDSPLEDYLRDVANLPPRDEEEDMGAGDVVPPIVVAPVQPPVQPGQQAAAPTLENKPQADPNKDKNDQKPTVR